jgi:hypothetical protein
MVTLKTKFVFCYTCARFNTIDFIKWNKSVKVAIFFSDGKISTSQNILG